MFERPRPFWVRLFCLLPFMMSVLVPVGMMPAVSGDGTITMVICTGHGPVERTFPAPDQEKQGATSWCPFSLLSAPALLPAPLYPARIAQDAIVPLTFAELDVPVKIDVTAPRPRGPPSIL